MSDNPDNDTDRMLENMPRELRSSIMMPEYGWMKKVSDEHEKSQPFDLKRAVFVPKGREAEIKSFMALWQTSKRVNNQR